MKYELVIAQLYRVIPIPFYLEGSKKIVVKRFQVYIFNTIDNSYRVSLIKPLTLKKDNLNFVRRASLALVSMSDFVILLWYCRTKMKNALVKIKLCEPSQSEGSS